MEPGENHPKTDERSHAKRETAILERATAIKLEWRALASAFSLPYAEPSRSFARWDHVLRESSWMSEDFMQERLWKQAAAVRVAQEVAQFDRSTLKPTIPKVLASIACAEYGRVVGGDDEEKQASTTTAAPASPVGPHPSLHPFPLLPYFICTEQTLAAVLKHLEDEEISWLARHSKATIAYKAAFEAACYLRPPEDDDLPCSSKKALLAGGGDAGGAVGAGACPPTKRKIKSHAQPHPVLNMEHTDMDDDMGLGPCSMMGGVGGGNSVLKSARRMGGELDMSREKRKRKTRDFNDEEDYMPGAKNSAMPRDRFPPRHSSQLLGRPEVTTSGGGAIGGLPSLPSNNHLRQGGRPKTSSAKPGTSGGLPRLDGMQGAVSGSGMMGGPRGSYGTRGPSSSDRPVTWSTQDDHVLAAIVTEFGHNWPLVADVLRSYSLMSGQYRRSDACKLRYSTMQKVAAQDAAAAAEAGGEQSSPAASSMMLPLMNKSQAKDTLANALPVHAEVLKQHQAVVGVLAARVQSKHQQEHKLLRESHKFRAEQHTSHYKILQSVNQATGSKTLSPLDINPIDQPVPPPPALSGSQPSGGAAQGGQGPSGSQQGQQGQQGQQQAQGQGSKKSGQQPHHHPQSSQQIMGGQQGQGHPSQMHGQQGGAGLDAFSPPSLQLGNVGMMGGSPNLGATGQPGQPGGPQLSGAPSQAAAQAAAAAVASATGNQAKPGGAMQQGGVMGLMGSGIPPLSSALPGGMPGGMHLGAGGPANGLPGGMNAARSPSPQMQFNTLNQQQKNMLQQLGRQGNMQPTGSMRPPLNPQQQVAAAATGGRFPNAGANIAGQAAGGLPGGGSVTPALAAQIQKGIIQQAANNPIALQAIHARMAAANAQQQQQQQGAALSRGMAQAGAPNPGASGSMQQQQQQALGMNPALHGGAGGFGMQLGGTGGVGFGLPPNPISAGMNLQQQYLAQAASLNSSAPRPQPNSHGGNS